MEERWKLKAFIYIYINITLRTLTPAGLVDIYIYWRADKYVPYGTEPRGKTYSIKYDLSRPELTDDQRRILAWPEQWEEYGLGEYGPGVPEEQSAKL